MKAKTTEFEKATKRDLSINKASKQRKDAFVTLPGAAGVAQVLDAFSLLPFHAAAEGMGKSMRALFKEITGQDARRLAKAKVRKATQQTMVERQQRWLNDQFKDFPENLGLFREHMASAPQTSSGGIATWATWIHQFEQPPALLLPMSKAVGLVIDELVEKLHRHCKADDLTAYRQTWLDHFTHHGDLIRIGGEEAGIPIATDDPEMVKLRDMTTWETATRLTGALLEGLYLDLVCAMDMEWGAWYFATMQPIPLFPLVMVKVQDGLLSGDRPKSRKNLIRQPQRRLLEFMHAIMEHRFKGAWREQEPLPSAIAKDLNLVSSEVSNYFDGTRRLTYKKVINYWRQLIKNCSGKAAVPAEMPAPPMPLVTVALHWQTLLVPDNGKQKTFFLVKLDNYTERWRIRRQRWEAQNSFVKEHPAGHPPRKPGEWPTWMLNQPSSSS